MASTKGTRLPSVSEEKAAADAASSPTAPPTASGGSDNRRSSMRSSLLRARTQRLFDVLVAEDDTDLPPNFDNHATTSITQEVGKTFLDRMKETSRPDHNRYQDFTEGEFRVVTTGSSPTGGPFPTQYRLYSLYLIFVFVTFPASLL